MVACYIVTVICITLVVLVWMCNKMRRNKELEALPPALMQPL